MDRAVIIENYIRDEIIKVVKSPLEIFFYTSAAQSEKSHIFKPEIDYDRGTLTFPKGKTVCQSFFEMREKLISSVLSVLLFLDENGIIYGDLKPSNIILYCDEFYLIDYDQIVFHRLPDMHQFRSQTYNFDNGDAVDHRKNLIRSFGILIFFLFTGREIWSRTNELFMEKNCSKLKKFFYTSEWKDHVEDKIWIPMISACFRTNNFEELMTYLPIMPPSQVTTSICLGRERVLLTHATPPTENKPEILTGVGKDTWESYGDLSNGVGFLMALEFYRTYRADFYEQFGMESESDSLFFASCLRLCHMMLDIQINYSALCLHSKNNFSIADLIIMVEDKIFPYLKYRIPNIFVSRIPNYKGGVFREIGLRISGERNKN